MATHSGRVELSWLLAAVCAAMLIAVVFLGWWPARVRLALVEAQGRGVEPTPIDGSSLASAIESLDRRLARIESLLAVHASRGARADTNPTSTTAEQSGPPPSGSQGLDELHKDMQQMSKRIDLLADSLRETYKPAFSLPTLEQVHAARRDVDWGFLNQVRELCLNDREAARARVRLMTFDDMLRKVGIPTLIEADGNWCYYRTQVGDSGQPIQLGVGFGFVGDTVSTVGALP